MDLKKPEENHEEEEEEIDYGIALQNHLDTITLASLPSIKHTHVLEVSSDDTVKEAIELLEEKGVSGALISDTANHTFLDRYVGYIKLSDMLCWCLKEYEKVKGSEEIENRIGVSSVLEECPDIAQTKIAELAKSFLWRPFFPAYLDDTLFHAMLLLSKHRLEVVPVIDRVTSRAIGFVTPIAVTQTLLQSSGLKWFDRIANTPLSKFRIENEEHVVCVYQNDSLGKAIRALRRSEVGVVAVVDRESEKLMGSLSLDDLNFDLKNKILLSGDEKLTVEEFLQSDDYRKRSKDDLPVVNKRTDTLKQAMENMAGMEIGFSFLVDESKRAIGVIGLGGVIARFAPPCMDSNIHGDGFFEAALDQTGCLVEEGTVVRKP